MKSKRIMTYPEAVALLVCNDYLQLTSEGIEATENTKNILNMICHRDPIDDLEEAMLLFARKNELIEDY